MRWFQNLVSSLGLVVPVYAKQFLFMPNNSELFRIVRTLEEVFPCTTLLQENDSLQRLGVVGSSRGKAD